MDDELQKDNDGEYTKMLRVQQVQMLNFLFDPSSPTFGKPIESAIRAGYTPRTAAVIHNEEWYKACNRYYNHEMALKAKGNLNEVLSMNLKAKDVKNDPDQFSLYKLKHDATKFTLENVEREEFHKKQSSHTTVNVLTISQVLNKLESNDRPQITGQNMENVAPLSD